MGEKQNLNFTVIKKVLAKKNKLKFLGSFLANTTKKPGDLPGFFC